jgi:GNAT superfamily N-acetyltransferase
MSTDKVMLAERCERQATDDYTLATSPGFAEQFGVELHVLGTTSVYVAAGIPVLQFNRVVGFGLESPATEQRLDQILEIYRRAGVASFGLQIAPNQPPELNRWMTDRGLEPLTEWFRVWMDLDRVPEVNLRPGQRIVEVTRAEASDYGGVIREGFGVPPFMQESAASIAGRRGWHCFIAYHDDQPASAVATFHAGDLAWTGIGATLQTFRGQGLMRNLMIHQARMSAQAGCHAMAGETVVPLAGQDNPMVGVSQNVGYQLLYRRPNWGKPSPAIAKTDDRGSMAGDW